jgi:tRNA 2-(methylsulfanyl)-N6-isopentenyladenosine37 hydroxylase
VREPRPPVVWQTRVGATAVPAAATDPRWIDVALADLDAVVADHLHCERKAAQSALSLVRSYPDHVALVAAVARLAHEETSHVVQVGELLARRGVVPRFDLGDELAQALRREVRKQEPGRLLDNLLVFALIEARSAERLALLAEAIPDAAMARTYRALALAEVRHRDVFLALAADVAPADEVEIRVAELAAAEATILAGLPLRPRIH